MGSNYEDNVGISYLPIAVLGVSYKWHANVIHFCSTIFSEAKQCMKDHGINMESPI